MAAAYIFGGEVTREALRLVYAWRVNRADPIQRIRTRQNFEHARLSRTAARETVLRLLAHRVKIFKRPDSNIEAGHQGVLDSGRAGEPKA